MHHGAGLGPQNAPHRALAEEPVSDLTVPSHLPAGANAAGDGVIIGHGPVQIDAFIDFLCPYCRQFELSSGPTLARLAAAGQASLIYHPMNFLDQASTTNYSTRAASAAGCAADRSRFAEYTHALFANQPPEGGPGLSDAELISIGGAIGMDAAEFAECVSKAPYLDWATWVTARATRLGVEATPTVLVAGAAVRPEAQAINTAVAQAAEEH
jgi:protein-disulfide isomerase